ncbi:MAG TPA: hypothetical protein VF929_03600 [Gemmatimonadaceae bacterium]
MTTKLVRPIRREIEIDGDAFTILLTQTGIRLTRKRFRQGRTVSWRSLRELSERATLGNDVKNA